MRVDRLGRPWILEVNANPDISPSAGLARMARTTGIDYTGLVRLVCDYALDRPRVSSSERWALTQRLSGLGVAAEVGLEEVASAR